MADSQQSVGRRRQIWAARSIAATPAAVIDHFIPAAAFVAKPDPNACPKCGRIVKQGKHLHQKHCKGPE